MERPIHGMEREIHGMDRRIARTDAQKILYFERKGRRPL